MSCFKLPALCVTTTIIRWLIIACCVLIKHNGAPNGAPWDHFMTHLIKRTPHNIDLIVIDISRTVPLWENAPAAALITVWKKSLEKINPQRILREYRKRQEVTYFRSVLETSQLNNLEGIYQGQSSLHATQPPMVMSICTIYGDNSFRSVCAVELIRHDVSYRCNFIANSWLNYLLVNTTCVMAAL